MTFTVPFDPEKLPLEADPPLKMGGLPLEFINKKYTKRSSWYQKNICSEFTHLHIP
jgi:hypothetical protein